MRVKYVRGLPLSERFFRFVKPGSQSNSGCWLWIGTRNGDGYGHLKMPRGFNAKAHRVAWRLFRGDIPTGVHVLHRCDTPNCVNPAHLFLGTNADNVADRQAKQRQARGARAGRVRLSEEAVKYIRSHAGRVSQRAMAARFGVGKSTVANVVRRKNWAHVLEGQGG